MPQTCDETAIRSNGGSGAFLEGCCSAEPVVQCFYKDKASLHSCSDSPPKDKGHGDWWAGHKKGYT